MWKRIVVLTALSAGLMACYADKDQPPVESSSSLCEMLKQKISTDTYETTDPATMQRKNAVEQAKLLKQYDAYGCPEVVDSAPPP